MPAGRRRACGRTGSREDFIKALDANMLTPIALMQAVLPAMIGARLGPDRQHHLAVGEGADPGARAVEHARATGLTGFVAGTQPAGGAEHGVTINNLLPGIHATDRADALDARRGEGARASAGRGRGRSATATIPARRYGTPEEFGAACAFLCSMHAGLHRRAEHACSTAARYASTL